MRRCQLGDNLGKGGEEKKKEGGGWKSEYVAERSENECKLQNDVFMNQCTWCTIIKTDSESKY